MVGEKEDEIVSRLRVSIVIPTYNRKEMLRECLESITKQTYPKELFEIIVVSGSTDGTNEMLEEFAARSPVKFRWFGLKNEGPNVARNFGIEMSEGEIICFTDDDCIADKNWLSNLVKVFESSELHNSESSGKVTGGVGGKILDYKQDNIFEKFVKMNQESAIRNSSFIITCNGAYRKEALEKVGGFDERLRTGEDWDIGIRVTLMGYDLKYQPDAIVYHKHRATFRGLLKQQYNYAIGHVRLGKKYKWFPTWQLLSFTLIKLIYKVVETPFGVILACERWNFLKNRILTIIILLTYLIGILRGLVERDSSGVKIEDNLEFIGEINTRKKLFQKLRIGEILR